MAAVYAATDDVLGRDVAVKVLAEYFSSDDAARARFTREARAAARVSDHPHVVTIYDIAETDGDPPVAFIVMELLAGGTVAERLKSGEPIPHALALRWLDQAADALDAAHATGMVHRDVKPANLLLDAQGTLKVADFGIATLASEAPLTMTGQVVGTAAYFSPEQALGRPATAASDRYALAVVAFELLTGRRPFPAGTPAAQALAHADTEPPPASAVAPGLPREVDAVLARGLAKDPAARPSSASALVSELEAALGPTAATGVAVPIATQRDRTPGRIPTQSPIASRGRGGHGRARALAVTAAAVLVALAAIALTAGGGKTTGATH
ncbi:MAG: eukaryotic-like serine/threonine-protein kinase, partial [Solirubrobacteraceae bacterium]|nr:eukaryotic-like serine/threonine-protein kinase [Solirubrobacteraceae bacterium]